MDLAFILSPAMDAAAEPDVVVDADVDAGVDVPAVADADDDKDQDPDQDQDADMDSARWSVHEMRHAVDVLKDFQRPTNRAAMALDMAMDVDEGPSGSTSTSGSTSATGSTTAPTSNTFHGLDLLFQADAMIQLRDGPSVHNNKDRDRDHSKETDLSLRSGVWSKEEEEYAAALIAQFLRGALEVAEGTTLRKFLADQLGCNRRRVSMKLATETIAGMKLPRKVGASVFVAQSPGPTDEEWEELETLRRKCFNQYEASRLAVPETHASHHEHDRDHQSMSMTSSSGRRDHVMVSSPARSLSDSSSPAAGSGGSKRSTHSSPESGKHRKSKRSPTQALKRRRPLIIRTGFDTSEEEEYVTAMVEYFLDGTLDLPNGTRLVTYLCEQLACSPMKLSMKLAPTKADDNKFPGDIGTATFTRKPESPSSNSTEVFEAEAHIYELRQHWIDVGGGVKQEDPEEEEEETVESPLSTPLRKAKVETTSTPRSKTPPPNPRPYTRSGPWSKEEEAYAAALIDAFFRGVLDIAEGTTLRAFLTSRLGCNPMRISKKLASENIGSIRIPKKLGSATYVRHGEVSEEERQACEEQLIELQRLQEDPKESSYSSLKHSRSSQAPLIKSPLQISTDAGAVRPPFKMRRMNQLGRRATTSSRRANPPEESSWAYRYQQVAYGT